jgi:hypothetical protein
VRNGGCTVYPFTGILFPEAPSALSGQSTEEESEASRVEREKEVTEFRRQWLKTHALLLFQTSMGGGFNITWSELMDFYVFDRDTLQEVQLDLLNPKKE